MMVLLTASVAAHVMASPMENNRYSKLALLPDRVSVSYTVYFGDQPGAGLRRQMDANRDGSIDERESRAFATSLLAEIGPNLELEMDGARVPASAWRLADLGLGTPTTAAGSFSVDLALETPFPPGTDHTLWFDDRWPVPSPGESELRVESAPSVDVTASHAGRTGRGVHKFFSWRGAPRTRGEYGVFVRFTASPVGAAEPATTPASPPAPTRRRWPLFVALAVLGGAVTAGTLRWVYLKRKG